MSSPPTAPPRISGTAPDAGTSARAAGQEPNIDALAERFRARQATIGVIGLGYVGLPLLCAAAARGFRALGFDIDAAKIASLNGGRSYLTHIAADTIAALRRDERLSATEDFARLGEADAVVICVPTPLTRQREPDLSFVERTTEAVAARLRPGQLIVLESTTYPGTTRDVMRPILERTGLVSGRDFFLAYSPEREDPGNASFGTTDIPKVVGGDGEAALRLASTLYAEIAAETVPVSSLETAEAVKLTENIFRSINIALVNELKLVFEAMGIDVWEVIEAAKTKPFGYMPFYPGPGLGGHCIPIDPFYLTWKAREFDLTTRFIELAGEINTAMPHRIVDKLAEALSERRGRALKHARILILGVAYKKNVADTRESPALKMLPDWDRNFAVLQEIVAFIEKEGAGSDRFAAARVPLSALRPLPPIARPGKMFYAAQNFQEHVNEMLRAGMSPQGRQFTGEKATTRPYLFLKAPSCLCGAQDDIPLPLGMTRIDWEAEIALAISRPGKRIPAARALDHVAGFMTTNDVSCRDLQIREDRPGLRSDWLGGKSHDNFAPMGPFLVPRAFVADHMNLGIRLTVNGEIKQDGNTSQFIFTLEEQIEYASNMLSLQPGDIFSGGTCGGVGQGTHTFLKPGDVMETEIEGLGRMRNRIVEEQAGG